MKTAIISPHTDDAIFSLGSFLSGPHDWGDVTIISPFAGIPNDEAGFNKHTTLRREHTAACEMLGVKEINGEFFDDVYGTQNEDDVAAWLIQNLWSFDRFLIPLGIHHPDHIFIRNVFIHLTGLKATGFYEELPYRENYPYLWAEMVQRFTTGMARSIQKHDPAKETVVNEYRSQVAPHLYPQLFVTEGIWL